MAEKFRGLFGAIALLLASGVLSLAAGEGAARVWMPHWRDFSSERFLAQTSVPGHGSVAIGRPGFDGYFAQNKGDFRVRVRINGFGLRQPEPLEAASGRIWVVGDSFAFGWGVEENEMYSSVLGRLSAVPTYNIASPGANICGYQRLVVRMPREIVPKIVVVGLTMDNDIAEYADACAVANVPQSPPPAPRRRLALQDMKEWATHHSALYNFFAVTLKRNPLTARWLAALGLVRPIAIDHAGVPSGDAARRAAAGSARETARIAAHTSAGTPVMALIIPSRFEILSRDADWTRLRELLVAALAAEGVAVADPTPELLAAGFPVVHFSNDGHWTPRAHAIAAQVLARALASSDR